MEQTITIRDFYGKILGFITVKPNGDKAVTDFFHKPLGFYYADRDVTTDFYGKVIARGDMSASLIK